MNAWINPLKRDWPKFTKSQITERNTTSARLIVFLKETHVCVFFHSFFSVRFVAKRHILQQTCLKGQMGTCLLWTRMVQLLALHIDAESHNAQRYSQTDGRMDGRTMWWCQQLISDHTVQQYDRLKWDTILTFIFSLNIVRFSAFLHSRTQQEICCEVIISDPTTPEKLSDNVHAIRCLA